MFRVCPESESFHLLVPYEGYNQYAVIIRERTHHAPAACTQETRTLTEPHIADDRMHGRDFVTRSTEIQKRRRQVERQGVARRRIRRVGESVCDEIRLITPKVENRRACLI